jgi:glutaredoxin
MIASRHIPERELGPHQRPACDSADESMMKHPLGRTSLSEPIPQTRVLLFTQPGCLSCELMRIYLEAREIAFEEHDITTNLDSRRLMTETYDSTETPTLIIADEVITGFDPARLDQYLDSVSSSNPVPEP